MESLGFSNNGEGEEYAITKDKVMGALRDFFKPEFLNRLDDVIVFDILNQEAIRQIVDLKIRIIEKRLLEKGILINISDGSLNHLSKEGYDPHFGARPLSRLIQEKILNPIAMLIITKGVKKGDTIFVSIKNGEILVENKKKKISKKVK